MNHSPNRKASQQLINPLYGLFACRHLRHLLNSTASSYKNGPFFVKNRTVQIHIPKTLSLRSLNQFPDCVRHSVVEIGDDFTADDDSITVLAKVTDMVGSRHTESGKDWFGCKGLEFFNMDLDRSVFYEERSVFI